MAELTIAPPVYELGSSTPEPARPTSIQHNYFENSLAPPTYSRRHAQPAPRYTPPSTTVSGAPVRPDLYPEIKQMLIKACETGDIDELKRVMAWCTDSDLMDVRTSDEETLLHVAAKNARVEVLELLLPILDETCLLVQDAIGRTPLHWSCYSLDVNTVRTIVPFMSAIETFILDNDGFSALALAICNNSKDIIAELGPLQIPSLPPIAGTALEVIIVQGTPQTIELMFETCAKPGSLDFWRIPSFHGGNVLHSALVAPTKNADATFKAVVNALKDEPDEMERLLNEGCELGFTALGLAASRNQRENIQSFFSHFGPYYRVRGMINHKSVLGSPYFLALTRGHTELSAELARAGAITNTEEMCGLTSSDWVSSVGGRPSEVPNRRKPWWKKWITIQLSTPRGTFPQLAIATQDNQSSARRAVLEDLDKDLASNARLLLLLAYHYFTLANRTKAQRTRSLKDRSKLFGMKEGTDIYALAIWLIKGDNVEFICDSCSTKLGSKFFACTACPTADFCEDCYKMKQQVFFRKKPMKMEHCHCHPEHIWVQVDLDKYDFRNEGYIFPNKTIQGYLDDLREKEKELN